MVWVSPYKISQGESKEWTIVEERRFFLLEHLEAADVVSVQTLKRRGSVIHSSGAKETDASRRRLLDLENTRRSEKNRTSVTFSYRILLITKGGYFIISVAENLPAIRKEWVWLEENMVDPNKEFADHVEEEKQKAKFHLLKSSVRFVKSMVNNEEQEFYQYLLNRIDALAANEPESQQSLHVYTEQMAKRKKYMEDLGPPMRRNEHAETLRGRRSESVITRSPMWKSESNYDDFSAPPNSTSAFPLRNTFGGVGDFLPRTPTMELGQSPSIPSSPTTTRKKSMSIPSSLLISAGSSYDDVTAEHSSPPTVNPLRSSGYLNCEQLETMLRTDKGFGCVLQYHLHQPQDQQTTLSHLLFWMDIHIFQSMNKANIADMAPEMVKKYLLTPGSTHYIDVDPELTAAIFTYNEIKVPEILPPKQSAGLFSRIWRSSNPFADQPQITTITSVSSTVVHHNVEEDLFTMNPNLTPNSFDAIQKWLLQVIFNHMMPNFLTDTAYRQYRVDTLSETEEKDTEIPEDTSMETEDIMKDVNAALEDVIVHEEEDPTSPAAIERLAMSFFASTFDQPEYSLLAYCSCSYSHWDPPNEVEGRKGGLYVTSDGLSFYGLPTEDDDCEILSTLPFTDMSMISLVKHEDHIESKICGSPTNSRIRNMEERVVRIRMTDNTEHFFEDLTDLDATIRMLKQLWNITVDHLLDELETIELHQQQMRHQQHSHLSPVVEKKHLSSVLKERTLLEWMECHESLVGALDNMKTNENLHQTFRVPLEETVVQDEKCCLIVEFNKYDVEDDLSEAQKKEVMDRIVPGNLQISQNFACFQGDKEEIHIVIPFDKTSIVKEMEAIGDRPACIYIITKTRHKFRFTHFDNFDVAASLIREHWGKKILKKTALVGPVHYYRSTSFKNWKEMTDRKQSEEELVLRKLITSKETEKSKQGHLTEQEAAFEQERVKQWVGKIPSMIKGSDSFEGLISHIRRTSTGRVSASDFSAEGLLASNSWERRREQLVSLHFKHEKLKLMVRQGIPPSLRGQLWQLWSGSRFKMNLMKDHFADLLVYYEGQQSLAIKEIEKDLNRSFPEHPFYQTQEGLQSLRRVLLGYSWRNQAIGYCQSMNIVVASILLFMSEEEAFWLTSSICEELLSDYYVTSMIGSMADQRVFEVLVQTYLPQIHKHLGRVGIPIQLISFPWFMCIYINCLPLELSNRILDCFFYEGREVFFKFGLAWFKMREEEILKEEEGKTIVDLMKQKDIDGDKLFSIAFGEFDNIPLETVNELYHRYKFEIIKEREKGLQSPLEVNNNINSMHHLWSPADGQNVMDFILELLFRSKSSYFSWGSGQGEDIGQHQQLHIIIVIMEEYSSSEEETTTPQFEEVTAEKAEQIRYQMQIQPRRITRGLKKQLAGELLPSRIVLPVNCLPDVFNAVMHGLDPQERVLYNEGKVQHLIMVQYHDKRFDVNFTSKEEFVAKTLETIRNDEKYKNHKADAQLDPSRVYEKNNVDTVAQVIKKYDEWFQSLSERQNRTMRGKIPYKHLWTADEIERLKEANRKYPRNNAKVAEIMGLHPNHIVYFKLALRQKRKSKK
ncbi:hypothetical protein PROFUN_12157 [Planoprotostelium fungivorum]|uniref:Rab-GAP TBC domain-containing protein n=1 Tax=Planoprotostelium fungivorum TaxID=1890364 RepID=A0A2P6N8C9_9EUKA|nr:hypothetical protein PROFUN_12157 [Planoprotostelium fungivorum]